MKERFGEHPSKENIIKYLLDSGMNPGTLIETMSAMAAGEKPNLDYPKP